MDTTDPRDGMEHCWRVMASGAMETEGICPECAEIASMAEDNVVEERTLCPHDNPPMCVEHCACECCVRRMVEEETIETARDALYDKMIIHGIHGVIFTGRGRSKKYIRAIKNAYADDFVAAIAREGDDGRSWAVGIMPRDGVDYEWPWR